MPVLIVDFLKILDCEGAAFYGMIWGAKRNFGESKNGEKEDCSDGNGNCFLFRH